MTSNRKDGINSIKNEYVLKIEDCEEVGENLYDLEAAQRMSKLNQWIQKINKYSSHINPDLNTFLSRLLFCFFSEDIGIFAKGIFTDSIKEYTCCDGTNLREYLSRCFDIMDTNMEQRSDSCSDVDQFPYVNGGLFSNKIEIPYLDEVARDLILNCTELDWTLVNPDIFGSIIQSVVSTDERYFLGIHYTSIPNIMKLIKPLFLDELYFDFDKAYNNRKKLNSLLTKVSQMKFFDPACGNGNFLIVTYKELRILEIKIWKRIRELSFGQLSLPFVCVTLDQFYGIEIDEFISQTAMLSLWLVEHQMNAIFIEEFVGVQIEALPLKKLSNIHCANSCYIDWAVVCPKSQDSKVYIMGNPPFAGSKMQTPNQRRDSEIVLKDLKNNKVLDYITNWFWLASKYIMDTKGSFAFVSTNSITQGEQVSLLWKPIFDLGLSISFAYTSFLWSNNVKDKAGVTCVIIGADSIKRQKKYLYDNGKKIIVKSITPYLTAGYPIAIEKSYKSPDDIPKINYGAMAYDNGYLALTEEEKDNIIKEYPTAEEIILPFMGARELIRNEKRYCLWISDTELEKAIANPIIKERIEKTTEFRLSCTDVKGRKLAERAHQFREFFTPQNRAIVIPRVSSEKREYLPIGYVYEKTIASDSAFVIYEAPLWLFGILSSSMHMLWIRSISGRLKNDFRYSGQLCYNSFPFPKLTEKEKFAIEEIVRDILYLRDEFRGKNLAYLYDPLTMPEKLKQLHVKLDKVVENAYSQDVEFTSDSQRLGFLFERYTAGLQKLQL